MATDPTPQEQRNGWDAESLARYRAERDKAAAERIDWTNRPLKPSAANSKYSPFRWRS